MPSDAKHGAELGTGNDIYLMGCAIFAVALFVIPGVRSFFENILVERSSKRNVYRLHASADSQHRKVSFGRLKK